MLHLGKILKYLRQTSPFKGCQSLNMEAFGNYSVLKMKVGADINIELTYSKINDNVICYKVTQGNNLLMLGESYEDPTDELMRIIQDLEKLQADD